MTAHLVPSTIKNLEYLQKVLNSPEKVSRVVEELVYLAHFCSDNPKDKDARKNLDASARFAKLVQDILENKGLWN
jgi:DNA-directed RNA polymerase subunit F